MLTKGGESEHFCLVPDFSRKAFNFLGQSPKEIEIKIKNKQIGPNQTYKLLYSKGNLNKGKKERKKERKKEKEKKKEKKEKEERKERKEMGENSYK